MKKTFVLIAVGVLAVGLLSTASFSQEPTADVITRMALEDRVTLLESKVKALELQLQLAQCLERSSDLRSSGGHAEKW